MRKTIIAGTVLALAAIAAAIPALAGSDATSIRSYDGRTLVRAVFYAEGAVAEALPTVRRHVTVPVDFAAYKNDTITRMAAIDSSVFDAFEAAVRSGDRVAVRAAYERAKAVFAQAAVEAVRAVDPEAAGSMRVSGVRPNGSPEWCALLRWGTKAPEAACLLVGSGIIDELSVLNGFTQDALVNELVANLGR